MFVPYKRGYHIDDRIFNTKAQSVINWIKELNWSQLKSIVKYEMIYSIYLLKWIATSLGSQQ